MTIITQYLTNKILFIFTMILISTSCNSEVLSDNYEELQSGSINICTDMMNEGEVNLSGIIVSIGDEVELGCEHRFTIETLDGNRQSFGYSISDDLGDSDRLSTTIKRSEHVSIGDELSVKYRYSMPFGSTSGLILSDNDGVILAVDGGAYDGALKDGDISGLTVKKDTKAVAKEEGPCIPTMGYSIVFAADQSTTVTPVSSKLITINNISYMAMALKSTAPGMSNSCYESDTISYKTWAIFRSN